MRERTRKLWIPLLAGLLLPTWNVVAQTATDSIASADSLVVPSVLPDIPDSLRPAATPADTVPSIRKKKDALDDPVTYESTDSMIWENGGYASLYGDSKVSYQNVQLTAAVIKMQMDSSLVYADGVRDSTGEWIGMPVFVDGSTPYESNHIRYNFKTEKGYINEIITQQGEGYMTSAEAKKGPDGEYYIADGIYTTCDQHDDPHFNIRITRGDFRSRISGGDGSAAASVCSVRFFPFPGWRVLFGNNSSDLRR